MKFGYRLPKQKLQRLEATASPDSQIYLTCKDKLGNTRPG